MCKVFDHTRLAQNVFGFGIHSYLNLSSAKELLDLRSRKAHPRSLPTMPPKDFVPTHSAEETATINAIVEEKMTYLKEERAERRYCLIILTFLSYIENNFFF